MKYLLIKILIVLLILTGVVYADPQAPEVTVMDTPSSLSSDTSYNLRVGGIGVVSYKYRLDNGGWSSENPVNDRIEFTLDTEGSHSLEVIGKNESGFWQAEDDPTQVSWIIDLTPPTVELSNYPRGTVSTTDAEIWVDGSDVAFYRYRIDASPWSIIYPVSKPISLSDLAEAIHTLDVIGTDQAFNWTDVLNIEVIQWEINTDVPTAILSNLPDRVTSQTSIDISVASPPAGPVIEDYVWTLDGGLTWSVGNATKNIQLSGMIDGVYTLCVNGFGNGVWQDGADGMSSIDNATCVEWRVDLTPADAAELAVSLGNPDSTTAKLSWTWSSNDPEETIQQYRVWYSFDAFDEATLDTATEVFCDITPGPQGYEEQFIIEGLLPGQQYYFAVDSMDVAGNISALSNVVTLTTGDRLPEIDTISLTLGGVTAENSIANEVTITGRNFLESERSNIIRFESSMLVFDFYSKAKAGSSSGLIFADIPVGAPAGTYQVRVINKNGVSNTSSDSITITEATVPLPVVRAVSPVVAPIGTTTTLTISGNNFDNPPAEVNLMADGGTATPILGFSGIDEETLTADVDVTVDFPEDRYGIQVVNLNNSANDVSAAKVELYRPVNLDDAEGAVTTAKMIDLMDLPNGMIPVSTLLFTDDRDEVGSVDKDRLKVKVSISPGSMFDVYDPIADWWSDYSGLIQPPRQVLAGDEALNTLSANSVQFTMGSENRLRLKNNQTVFVIIDISLPSDISELVVFYIEPDGTLIPAGADGTWRSMEINQGGTILATQPDNPEVGKTAYTIGLLLSQLSEYVISGFMDSDDDGVGDYSDSCPNDPNKIDPGVCGCGIADTDTDDDGTPDCIDFQPIATIISPDSDQTINVGESINFQSEVSSGNPPFTYSWDFEGGAENSNQRNPGDIVFDEAGAYNVVFVVADNDGDISSDTVTITVNESSGGGDGDGGSVCFIDALGY